MTRDRRRRGIVIVIVAVVIMLVSLSAYGFLTLMVTEHKAARARGDQLQAESVAVSGREYLAAILEAPRSLRPPGAVGDDLADQFGGVVVDGQAMDQSMGEPDREGRFSLVVGAYSETAARSWRFGYENESAKLNLGQLVVWDRYQPGSGRLALGNLPGMDDETADAILDWVDRDNVPREFGAEADYYRGLDPPLRPRNGVPTSLEELLLVRGVTREKLFGVDLNVNYRVDSWEESLAREQADSGAAEVASPWSRYLTVYSSERDESFEGEPRIQLNQSNLGKLHQELTVTFEPAWANFIVAYRQFGSYRGSGEPVDASSYTVDLSLPPKRTLRSPLDLIGVRVRIPTESKKERKVLESPFTTDPGQMREYLPKLLDHVTTGRGGPIFGRVNVNLAPREVLLGVPGIDAELAERILASRSMVSADDDSRHHAGWLLAEGLVDASQMRRLLWVLTTGGDVGRAQIMGYYDLRSPMMRFETVVDATEKPARQVYYKDLRRLGRGALKDVINVTSSP